LMALPIRTSDRGPAVLAVTLPDDEFEHEHLARRRRGGGGAVRLLSAPSPPQSILALSFLCLSPHSFEDWQTCGSAREAGHESAFWSEC
jgi:hypothetical protein